MCMHARMRRLVWSGDGRRRRSWPARGKICACAFLVHRVRLHCFGFVKPVPECSFWNSMFSVVV